VVAIDSEDESSIQNLTNYLSETFSAAGDYAIQTIEGPQAASPISSSSRSSDPQSREIVDYLTVVAKWHNISESVIDYITTPPAIPSSEAGDCHQRQQQQLPKPSQIPIALIPHFALSTTDLFASNIPITDSYAPVDHWSWVATMWRGIVGADATVWIRCCDREEKDRAGEVEVKTEYGAVVWRVCDDDSESERERGRRRVGFEVGELVRSVARLG
jgi:HMG box factor